jgi:hypothetical protein
MPAQIVSVPNTEGNFFAAAMQNRRQREANELRRQEMLVRMREALNRQGLLQAQVGLSRASQQHRKEEFGFEKEKYVLGAPAREADVGYKQALAKESTARLGTMIDPETGKPVVKAPPPTSQQKNVEHFAKDVYPILFPGQTDAWYLNKAVEDFVVKSGDSALEQANAKLKLYGSAINTLSQATQGLSTLIDQQTGEVHEFARGMTKDEIKKLPPLLRDYRQKYLTTAQEIEGLIGKKAAEPLLSETAPLDLIVEQAKIFFPDIEEFVLAAREKGRSDEGIAFAIRTRMEVARAASVPALGYGASMTNQNMFGR